jgi:2'-5' RNA ligase
VGLFIPLPEDLAAQYPTKSEDPSPAHVTFLYVGSVPEGRAEEFKIICTQVFSEVRGPIRAALRGLDRFLSPEQKVIFSRVRFSRDLNRARDLLRTRLESAGFEVKDSFPRWNPHVTIAYVPVDAEVKVEAPVGTWDFDSIQVWGMGDPENIPLGSSPGFETSQTPTQDAERLASIQAMRELSLRWSQL